MEEFLIVAVYILNMLFAIIALILFFVYLKIRKNDNFYVVPKSLRLLFLTSFIPFAIIEVIGSILFSMHYLIIKNEDDFWFKLIRAILGPATQHVRGTLFIIVIERIASTVYLGNYVKFSAKSQLFVILTLLCSIMTVIYGLLCVCWIFLKSYLSLYNYVIYIASFCHFSTIAMAYILLLKNQAMYSLLAYRVSLRTRYQIVENVKVLRYFGPTIIIFTLIAPIGVLTTLFYTIISKSVAPSSLFLLTYNLAFALILFYEIMNTLKMKRIEPFMLRTSKIAVISPLGKNLPIIMTSETYFKDLRKQWA